MPADEARNVTVNLKDNGVIESIQDKDTPWRPDWYAENMGHDEELPLDGEQYEWSLQKYRDTGIDIAHLYTSRQRVAVNNKNDTTHRNTVGLKLPKLIKLDAGHWGAYKRWREFPNGDADGEKLGRQREFGMIENRSVWLCQYYTGNDHAAVASETARELKPDNNPGKAPLAARLADLVASSGVAAIKLKSYAAASHALTDNTVAKALHIILPDMHLPEAWPDLPADAQRHPDAAAQMALQKHLRNAQRKPGNRWGNCLTQAMMNDVQDFIAQHPDQTMRAPEPLPVGDGNFTFKETGTVRNYRYTFTPAQFFAEKAIVDREFRLRSTWFYARGKDFKKEPKEGNSDWRADIDANGNGDPLPAIDLLHFLAAIKELKAWRKPGDAEVKLVQVGDIFEAWVNHEFLYAGWWVRDTKSGSSTAAMGILQGGTVTNSDGFQPRFDRDWADKGTADHHPNKRYVYHELSGGEMLRRYVVGDMIRGDVTDAELESRFSLPPNELSRRKALLKDRLDNIADFSLPFLPDSLNLFKTARQNAPYIADLWSNLGAYTRTNRLGESEFYFNRMILDIMYQDLGVEAIYGNHDGYRGDPILNQNIGAYACPGYISKQGIWFEHSHRWDPFNRDGCAFGAGAANLTYYWFNNLCNKSSGKFEGGWAKQEQACFQPGAALWFLLVNYGRNQPWLKDQPNIAGLKDFGIYVSGHTHCGDLISMTFAIKKSQRAQKAITEVTARTGVVKSNSEVSENALAEDQAKAFNQQQNDSSGKVSPQLAWLRRPTAS